MVVRETANPGDLSSKIELRVALNESGLGLLAGGDIRNAGDPANHRAIGTSIRNVNDAVKGPFRTIVEADPSFKLDALAREHALNVGEDGVKRGFAQHLHDGSSDNSTQRQTRNRRICLVSSPIAKVTATSRDADAGRVQNYA